MKLGLFVRTDGKKAYFASNQFRWCWDGICMLLICMMLKPVKKVLFLKGQLKDENGQLLDNATIEFKKYKSKEKHIVQVQDGA